MGSPSIKTVTGWYDQSAAEYDASHQPTQRKYKRIERSMVSLLDAGRVLDLGCGTGRLLGKGVVGVDLSMQMLARAHNKSRQIVQADGHHLPFADGCFDAVIAAQGVIRYMDPNKAFGEIARVLRLGGRCAVHQFGQAVSLRQVLGRAKPVLDKFSLANPDDLIRPAQTQGLFITQLELFRSIPRYPYAVRIPQQLPGKLWNHCVMHFERGSING